MKSKSKGLFSLSLAGYPAAALLILLFFAADSHRVGEDFWWHAASGRELLRDTRGEVQNLSPSSLLAAAKRAPMKDPFSFTAPARDWINPEWLSQVLFFALFSRPGGENWVALLKVLVLTMSFMLLLPLARLRGSGIIGAALAALAAGFVSWPFFDLRPEFFTFLSLAVLLLLLHALGRGKKAALFLLPFLFFVWANLHGGFTFGLGILLLHLFLHPLHSREGSVSLRAQSAAVALSLSAAMLNPYGPALLLFPFHYFSTAYTMMVEWSSPFLPEGNMSPAFWFLAAAALFSLLRIFLARGWKKAPFDFLLVFITLCMSLWARRFIPLFCLAYAPRLGKDLADLGARLAQRSQKVRVLGSLAAPCMGWGAAIVGGLMLMPLLKPGTDLFSRTVKVKGFFPQDAVTFIKRNGLEGRMFNDYAWGGYLMYHLYPDMKVFIDGRGNMVYDDEILEDAIDILRGAEV